PTSASIFWWGPTGSSSATAGASTTIRTGTGGQTTGPRARRTRLPGHAAHVGTGLPPVGGDGTDAADDAPPPGASQGTAEVSPAGRSITARVPVLGWRPAWFSDGVWQQDVAISPATAAHIPSVTAGGRGTRCRHGRDSEGAPHGEGRPTRRGAPHPPRGTPPAEGHPTQRKAPHTPRGAPPGGKAPLRQLRCGSGLRRGHRQDVEGRVQL